MAVPSYTTDLTIFDDANDNTSWVEMTNMAVGGGPDTEVDLAIYGTQCVSQQVRKTGLASMAYNNGTGVTIGTNEGFFVWQKYFAPNSISTLATNGTGVVIGSSVANWARFSLDGSDTYAYGGWVNYFCDPLASNDGTNGTYGTTYQYCGSWLDSINAVGKGNPHSVDIIRYGRGESRFTGGEAANYATFDGFALVNDNATTGRWGLIQDVGGSYLYKGLMSLGLTGTLVDFRDSNVNITIDDTLKATAAFNRIEVHNASSNVEWTSINFTALGTTSRGQFEMIDNATVSIDTCVFTDMDTFIFDTNATILNSTFRRCNQITLGGADMDDSIVTNSTAATSVLATSLDTMTDNSFESDGSNHAVELSSIGGGSMTWGNTLTGYVAGTAGSPVTPTSTGNEAIYVNVGTGTLTINVAAGATTPSIRSAGATVNVVSSFTLTLTGIPSGVQTTIVNSTTRTELQNSVSTGADITYAHSGGETVDILFMANAYDPNTGDIYDLTLASADQSIPTNIADDRNYENPA